MKIIFESHAYAPELNRAIILTNSFHKVKTIKAPSCTRRDQLFKLYKWRKVHAGIYAEVCVSYPREFAYLNRKYSGYVSSRLDGLKYRNTLKNRHHGGPLLDGSILPDPIISIRFRIIG